MIDGRVLMLSAAPDPSIVPVTLDRAPQVLRETNACMQLLALRAPAPPYPDSI